MSQDDRRLERIEMKIDLISDHMSSIDVTLGAQHVSLKEHIRRTEILENELKPIKKRHFMQDGVLKLITVLVAIAEIIHLLSK